MEAMQSRILAKEFKSNARFMNANYSQIIDNDLCIDLSKNIFMSLFEHRIHVLCVLL